MTSEYPTDDTLAVAFVIGGHSYEVPMTLTALESLPGMRFYPQDLPSFIRNKGDALERYDAAVFYNFHGHGIDVNLTDDARELALEAVRETGEAGVGILPLHHGVAAFPDAEEWADVCGLAGGSIDGAYTDQRFRVDVADRDHSITRGLDSFEFTDETYTMDEPDDDSEILLTTDHDPGMEALAWTRRYRNSRVFCYQSGHGRNAFTDRNFLTVLARGIRWVADADEVSVTID